MCSISYNWDTDTFELTQIHSISPQQHCPLRSHVDFIHFVLHHRLGIYRALVFFIIITIIAPSVNIYHSKPIKMPPTTPQRQSVAFLVFPLCYVTTTSQPRTSDRCSHSRWYRSRTEIPRRRHLDVLNKIATGCHKSKTFHRKMATIDAMATWALWMESSPNIHLSFSKMCALILNEHWSGLNQSRPPHRKTTTNTNLTHRNSLTIRVSICCYEFVQG